MDLETNLREGSTDALQSTAAKHSAGLEKPEHMRTQGATDKDPKQLNMAVSHVQTLIAAQYGKGRNNRQHSHTPREKRQHGSPGTVHCTTQQMGHRHN